MATYSTAGNGGGNGGRERGFMDSLFGQPADLPKRAMLYARVGYSILGALMVFVLISRARGVYAEWLWFSTLELSSVYRDIVITQLWLLAAGFVVMGGLAWLTCWAAVRNAWGPPTYTATPAIYAVMRRMFLQTMAMICFVVALSFATALTGRWELFLKFLNSSPWGAEDPVFGHDVGFYVFTMPMLHTLQGWLMAAAIALIAVTAVAYVGVFYFRAIRARLTRPILRHFAVLGAFLMATIAAGHWLDTYETLFSTDAAVTGATYTDVTARIPALRVLTGIAALAALAMLFSVRLASRQQALRLVSSAAGLWLVSALLAGLLWPSMVQRFSVQPNELERERPYIERSIAWTRDGFDLARVSERPYDVADDRLAQDIAANPATVSNIRLWDPRPLLDVYNQIQHLRLYYSFLDPDIDRYYVDGEYRQVLLGTRELIQDGLDPTAQNWVNRRLVYTHGYGVVMSPATDFTEGGQPTFFLKDVPLTGVFEVTQPRVYYGEAAPTDVVPMLPGTPRSDDAVIVNTTEPEFDRPPGELGGQPEFIDRYEGTGGVRLSSLLRRVAYAWELRDLNILISGQLTNESRVLYRRHIQERTATVAPFLRFDRDPYMVVHDGRLLWIQDAYTVTDRLPYAQRFEQPPDATRQIPFIGFNYIRNSVKVVIDAYNGSVTFYTIEPHGEDPMLRVFRNAFPALFTPISEMPAGLREHLRYPEVLLRAQAETFLQFHMTDPKEFFLKEDQWEIPLEVIRQSQPVRVQPYYVIMQLPGEEREEFVLILPFTPQDKPNLVAWMAARSDGDNYGEIQLFTFPTDRLFNGPEQVEARIDNDPAISEQFTLWGQSGSIVIRGNLLVIPIGESLLYAEPVYLQADTLDFPELKRVILATADTVVMEPTLTDAIEALLGRSIPATPAAPGEPVPGGIAPEELRRALEALQEALDALRQGVEGIDEAVQGLTEAAGA